MKQETCPVCGEDYERRVQTDKEQARIETQNLGSPPSNKRTTGVGTTGTELCIRRSGWTQGLDIYLH